MVGVSAGSAQLISYLGRAGASTPVGAACVICPAWDVQTAFASMSISQPLAERVMVTITSDDL
jgi:predicted alpha/beta-fold hydrolase